MGDHVELERLEAALADVLAEVSPGRSTATKVAPGPRPGVVHLDDEDRRLPPIRSSMKPAATVADALADSGAGAFVPAWYVLRESATVFALFWLAILVFAFAAGTEDLGPPLMAAVVARGVWLTWTRWPTTRRH